MFSSTSPQLAWTAQQQVGWQFFYVGTTLGLAGWGLVFLTARSGWHLVRRSGRGRFEIEGASVLAITLAYVFWCLMLLNSNSTVIHQGTYFLEILGLPLG